MSVIYIDVFYIQFEVISLSGESRLPNHGGKTANAGSAGRYGASLELVIGDGGALDSAPHQVALQTVGQVAAIEPVGPLPQVAGEVLGADPMLGVDHQALMLVNGVWMIGKNSPALALSP